MGIEFDGFPTASEAKVFNNERYYGIVVRFSEKGFGFGEITFAVDKETGEAKFDDEEMSPERCGRIIERLAGTTIEPNEWDMGPDDPEETPG